MEKTLQLYTYVDGGIGDTPFPNAEGDPIEIGAFRYDAKRMGGAPIITASVNYPSCLDNEWTDNVYAEFNGEKYFLKQTPTSSYDNQDSMYKHEVELVSERVILDNVYFYDAVASSEKETSPIIGNPPASPEWQYFGNIDISKDYTTFSVRQASGFLIGIFDVVFDRAIRIVSGPPIDMRIESATGDIYVYDNYSCLQAVGLNLVFSYIDYDDDKPVSNSTKVVFFGDIREFASRLQSSLEYRGLDYTVVVDDDVVSEEKLMSFEDQFFSNVLQEIYNTYEVPYYFVGKTIHIGFANEAVVPPTFSYGVDDALLSITKNNANFKVVNRVTGTGSSDNIPFYYPNNSPKGEIDAFTNREELKVKIIDHEVFCDKVEINKQITYRSANCTLDGVEFYNYDDAIINDYFNIGFYGGVSLSGRIKVGVSSIGHARVRIVTDIKNITNHKGESVAAISDVRYSFDGGKTYNPFGISEELFFDKEGDSFVNFNISIHVTDALGATLELLHHGDVKLSVTIEEVNTWDYDGKNYNLKDLGLDIASGIPQYGDTISQVITNYIKTAPRLMPSIYRETNGEERFYNAVNGIYDGLEFKNPYVEGRPKEHIITVEDVKPTIKDVKVLQPEGSTFAGFALNSDMFTEFAYDRNDNDETEDGEDENSRDFKHSYFFGKLRVLDFNLFDHAIENQPMTVSFTSGDCGACNFTIGVTEEFPQKNPVQVDDDGNLIYDEKTGNVVCGVDKDVPTFQERQQDTSKYEVWIALKKEEDTYGILMPKAPKFDESGEQMDAPYRPKSCTINEDGTPNNDGDTFVILGINLPKSYILNAEKKLEEEIIKYLKENNEEKFTFSIGFSRIYFEENPDVLQYLNENSRLNVTYNGKTYLLYITSYSYQMSEGDALPQITVELDENLTVSQNALQNAISEVKSEVGRALSNIDVLALSNPFFIRKDIDDVANGKTNFVKGIKFGEGGKVEVMDNNSAKLTIEYLEVTKKASFTSLEIKEKTHVGGQIVISPAAMTCGEVEELDEVYRCHFQTKGANGDDEIFNQFAINDLAICQTYNSWGSRYYWRKVVGIGEDYIDLSKTICDEDSDIPMAGDKIVQLGNTENITRQAAQVLSAYGEDAPSFIMYNGINDFSLADKNITGIAWNPNTLEPQMYSYGSFFFGDRKLNDNFITFQKKEGDTQKTLTINADVTIGANSSGLTNLSEWSDKQKQIDDARAAADNTQKALEETAEQLGKSIQEVMDIVDSVNAATKTLDTRIADVETGVKESVAEINERLDGVVENYFEEGAPTTKNKPVTDWIDASDEDDYELINHVGDTYTNIEEYVDNDKTPTAGKSWRWCWCDDSSITDKIEVTDKEGVNRYLHWHPIADSDAVKALLEASKAKTAADRKSKTFVTQPVPPYKEGDLWVQGTSGDIYRCKDGVDRTSGSYTASDWELASKYTDDTTAKQALKDAAEAQESAEKANAVAEAAKEVTDALNDDNIFTLVEKRGIRNALKEINPSEEDHVITRYYELSSVTNAGTGTWSEITDKEDEDYGWYVSNMHEHNGCAIAKVTFNVATLCSVTMHIMSRSDTIYDYTLLGELDGEKLSSPSYLTSGIVADTRNIAVGTKVSHTFYAVSEGEHSVYVYFRKNVNTSVGLDNGYFRLDASPYQRGSLGDYLALCEKKGISGGNAEYYANDLFFAMYHTYKVWENSDTDLSSFEGYRDQMMMLFQYYYASIIELQQSITQSDYDYLTHVFGKGNNLNVEGVVMSQMLAVRNTENEVQAFLNGSNIGKDETHGKLLIAAGIEDITKPEEAKTKIYEDGRIEVDAPTVNGKVIISDDGLTYYDTSGSVEKLRASMGGTCAGASGVFIAHNASKPDFCTNAAILAIGGDGTSAGHFHGDVVVSGILDARSQGVWCNKIESLVANTIEIVLPEDDSLTRTIRIPYGMIEGFRPKTRVLKNTANTSSPHMLTHLDHSVFVNISSGTCYIALPNNPQDGQEYYIESRGGNMNIKLTGKSGYSMYSGTTLAANTSVTQTGRALLRFKFYSDANLWVISWLNRDNA